MARGTTPLTAPRGGHSFVGDDGPTRPGLVERHGPLVLPETPR